MTRSPRFSCWPAEWLIAIIFVIVAVAVLTTFKAPLARLDIQIYYNLATAFFSGWILAVALSYADQLLRGLPDHPRWRLMGMTLISLVALWLFFSFGWVKSFPVVRLTEAFAFSAVVGATLLTLFLPVSGFLSARETIRTIGTSLRFWVPLLCYLTLSGLVIGTINRATPLVWDPVVLRMDVSLGFCPTLAVFHWEWDKLWVAELSNWGYPLLAIFIIGITVRILADGAFAHARRAALSILLVGLLGIVSYAVFPVVGPLFAFPDFFHLPDPLTKTANAALGVALNGPSQIPVDPIHPRNAMPSLHTAFSLVALAAAWSWSRRFFWLCLPVGVVQIITTMTLCVHYLVDLFVAVPLATLCWWLAGLGVRHTGRVSERLPALILPVKTTWLQPVIFLSSLALSVGLFLLWAHAAPLPPYLAWPLAVVAMFLPIITYPRAAARNLCKLPQDMHRKSLPC